MTPTSRPGRGGSFLRACAVAHERIHQAEAASLQQIHGWDVFHIDTSRQVRNGCGVTGLQGGVERGFDDAWWGAWGRRDVVESRHVHAKESPSPKVGPAQSPWRCDRRPLHGTPSGGVVKAGRISARMMSTCAFREYTR